MAKKRKAESQKGPSQPGKKGCGTGGDKDKKHCHAFNFGKGQCRYGAKCRFEHDKNGKPDAGQTVFSPQQKKIVSAMVASAIKKTAKLIAKKGKAGKRETGQRESKGVIGR
jgi:hypothetical protein